MAGGTFDLGTYGAEIIINDSQFTSGMQSAENSMNSMNNRTKGFAGNIGKLAVGAIAGLGAALVGAGVAGVKMADDLQKSLNQLQSATGATDQEMKAMEQSVKSIYTANLGESLDHIAQSMATVKQNTGLAGQELENVTKNALVLSKTFDMEINESTRAAKAMMEKFGISSDQAFNLMAQGAQNGANKNGDLLDTLNEYSPAYAALGFSAEQFMNTLIDGAESGAFSIDKVGDAIKEFNIRAKDGSKASAEAFQILGFNAEEMTSKFAQGGETAQGAFQEVVKAISDMEDPFLKNAAAVGLFGTMAEDLEMDAIKAFANIGTKADSTKDTMEEITKINYSSFGEALTGIGRIFQMELIDPIQKYVLPLLTEFAQYIQTSLPQVKETMSSVFSSIGQVFTPIIEGIKTYVNTAKEAFSGEGNLGNSFARIFESVKSIALPILTEIITFVKSTLDNLKQFWDENGTQIIQAVQNAWSLISGIIGAVAPVITFIVQSLFENVKGVITGALDVIMGAIKIFTGLFTGDFQKMWEGTKQLFSGAIEAIWNLVNLMFVAKIIGGIKAFIASGVGLFRNFLDDAVNIFRNLDDHIMKIITGFVSKITSKFKSIYDDGARIFGTLKTFGETTFRALFTAIKTVVDNIYTSVVNKLTSMGTGARQQFDGVLSSARTIFDNIKNAITNPIETAKETVRLAIESIKGFFANMKVKIPMPHFNFTTATANVAGVSIPYPKFDVDWYKTGGFFDKASIVGLGEAGKEAILPLENKRYMSPFADAIFERLVDRFGSNPPNQQMPQVIEQKTEQHYHFKDITVQANNMDEFINSLNHFRRMK